jgi:hypothetical protein
MSNRPPAFKYSDKEVAAIRATLHSRPFHRFPDAQFLETLAGTYLFHVSRGRSSLSKKQIAKEQAERDRIVERVRRAVPVYDRAERIEAIVEREVAESIDADDPLSQLSRTRLLAKAMFDGEIDAFDLEALIVRDYLSNPNRLNWRGGERWLFADDRKKAHRFEYINQLVCFWAEDQCCRPDEVSVSAVESAHGDCLMDFILAAAGRPLQEAGEEIGTDRILDIVHEVKEHWRGRPWGDPELEAILAEEAELDRRRATDNLE